jgi:capsule polysaccharide export protein KpsE/RkpR
VVDQKVDSAAVEDHPLVKSLRAVLKEIDDQYERERQSLIATSPNTSVKDRALAMLESRHFKRRGNYLRELTALRERA